MFRRLRELGQGPDQARVLAALRETYLTCALLGAVPGLLVAPIALLDGPQARSTSALLAWVGVALVCALLCVWLAGRAYQRRPDLPRAVQASIQAAPAPAVPFLMGCATLGDALTVGVLWALALLTGGLVWLLLPRWAGPYPVAEPEAQPG